MIRISLTIEDDCLAHAIEKLRDVAQAVDAGASVIACTTNYVEKKAGVALQVSRHTPDVDFLRQCRIVPDIEVSNG